MKFSKIFKFFILFNLLLPLYKNVIANQQLPNNDSSSSSSSMVENDKSPNDSSSPFTLLLFIIAVILLVVLFFLFIIYMKKYKALKKQLENNKNILPIFKAEEEISHYKNMEIVVRDPKRTVVEEDNSEGSGNLVFLSEEIHFELDDLLKASAEGLGKGNFGNCYKAMLEKGPIVVVKRMRELKPMDKQEFVKQVRGIAEWKHPNLMPILGYYYSKEEKLLLYKYLPNGNAYNRLHDGRGKPTRVPFRWSSRLAVARGVARALAYLHLNIKSPDAIPHGNLKLTNVLLDENDSVLVTDYALISLISNSLASQRMAAFKSPEFQNQKKISRKSDVRSYGCLLLELLTGRISSDSANSSQDPNNNGVDLASWVHRAVREEWTAEIFDVEISAKRSANAGMVRLLQIAIRCCEKSPELRPEMSEVVREVEKIAVIVDSEDDGDEFGSMERSLTDDSVSAATATPSRSTEDDLR